MLPLSSCLLEHIMCVCTVGHEVGPGQHCRQQGGLMLELEGMHPTMHQLPHPITHLHASRLPHQCMYAVYNHKNEPLFRRTDKNETHYEI